MINLPVELPATSLVVFGAMMEVKKLLTTFTSTKTTAELKKDGAKTGIPQHKITDIPCLDNTLRRRDILAQAF